MTRTPTAPLQSFVQLLFYARGEPGYQHETVFPMGHPTLLINLGTPFRRTVGERSVQIDGGMLLFQQTQAAMHSFTAQTHVVGAALQPDGAGTLLGRDVSPHTDGSLTMISEWPSDWTTAMTSLTAAAEDAERCISVLQAWLAHRTLAPPDEPVRLAVRAIEQDPDCSISALAPRASLSHKQLIARFKARVGIPPKKLAALLKMAAAMAIVAEGSAPNWAALAASAGYADQAHFGRAFKRFSGLTPTEYEKRRRWAEQAVGMEDESGFFVPVPEDGAT